MALQEQAPRKRGLKMAKDTNLLQGLLFDENGIIYSPSFSMKGPDKRRYRYYISRNERTKKPIPEAVSSRLPAQETEELVERTIRDHLYDIHKCAELLGADMIENHQALVQITQKQGDLKIEAIMTCLERIIVKPEKLVISIRPGGLCELIDENLAIKVISGVTEPAHLIATIKPVKGKRGTLVVAPKAGKADMFDLTPAELKKLVQGFIWMDEHIQGRALENIAVRNNCSPAHVGSLIHRCLLA